MTVLVVSLVYISLNRKAVWSPLSNLLFSSTRRDCEDKNVDLDMLRVAFGHTPKGG